MNYSDILGPQAQETRYITNCGSRIKLDHNLYFKHVHSCQICKEKSPFINQMQHLNNIENYQFYELIGLKSTLEILVDEINQNFQKKEFYSDEYEEFLLSFDPFMCTDCGSAQIPQNQKEIKYHIKNCKDARENAPFYQQLQKINFSDYWEIHIKAFTLDVLYIINLVTLFIIKKLVEQYDKQNQKNFKGQSQKCEQCESFKSHFINHEACNTMVCTDCHINKIKQQLQENCLLVVCFKCQKRLSSQFIYKIVKAINN
ncbi:unnamed protein product [Paramecium sonneborni]|uniref:Uncharacterized protein n=1 Tax=Paramecium sonneborni TaxID=65129 RepID=A0A8S1MEK0_9CILI|nr:unnamed protein product [Paramecium sonneborni]